MTLLNIGTVLVAFTDGFFSTDLRDYGLSLDECDDFVNKDGQGGPKCHDLAAGLLP